MALTSGTKLGPYEIQSPLGAGGMGEVYRARDVRLDRTVAVKVLASHLSSSPELKQRMEREARAISSLNHPHICHLYDIGSQDGNDYLVMEFLEGETLAERLRKGALPLSETLKIGIAVAEALAVAHRQGIVHRDLKPGNIMLTKGGAKLKPAAKPDEQPNQQGDSHGTEMTQTYTNCSIPNFILGMQFFLDRPVVDQTGLTGHYDFAFRYTADEVHATDPNAPPGLFTAVQEQLGLKLEAKKGPVEVLVVDHMERPSAN